MKNNDFRSHTEARWAVFFEDLGIQFQYEPQAYRLFNGDYYLPDFFLPQINAFAEIKDAAPTIEEMLKCEQLTAGTGNLVLVLDGPPDFRSYAGVSDFEAAGPIWVQYSLDIDDHKRRYFYEEHRLFSEPDFITEKTCTHQYKRAIWNSRYARFDGSDEPFNPTDREIREAWK